MTQPIFRSPNPTEALLLALANTIEQTFTPMAFRCACAGEDPSCKKIIEGDRYALGQFHTVQRIADLIRKTANQ